ncbi:MAG: TIGR02444 family protein [Cellvibrionaceae bacterium]
MTSFADSGSLWEFALALYSSPGVEETALHLQDAGNINVNILLWACWLEARAIPLTPALLSQAKSTIVAWDTEVIRVLRGLRRRLAQLEPEQETAQQIRGLIKQAELLAEKRCLSLLGDMATPLGGEALPLGHNMGCYLKDLPIEANLTPIRQGLAKLLSDA